MLVEGDKEGARLIKKYSIVGIIQRILQFRNDLLNDEIKQILLTVSKDFNDQFGYLSKGIMAILSFFTNNPAALIQTHLKAKPSKNLSALQDYKAAGQEEGPSNSLEVYQGSLQGRAVKNYNSSALALPSTDPSQNTTINRYHERNLEEIEKIKANKE